MLRPSKLFVSFHQLRHYFQTKLSELVQPVNPSSQIHVQHFFNFFHPPPSVFPRQPSSRISIVNAVQQFHQIKSPINHATIYHRRPILWTPQGQQVRNMMSTTGTSNGSAGIVWGFPRPNIGGRGVTRQFSTTKTPCISNVQTNQTHQANFIHISSRIFSPTVTKKNSPLNDDQFSCVDYPSLTQPNEADNTCPYNRIFAVKNNGGMRELVNVEKDDIHHYVHQLSPRKRNRIYAKKNDSIIQNDELSSMRHHVNQHRRNNSVRKGPDKVQNEIYLLVLLEHSSITSRLEPSFIRWFNQKYQDHIYNVTHLLELLQKASKQFEVVVGKSQLRIYFPHPSPASKIDAIRVLESMGIKPSQYYSIEQDSLDVGPDYFKNIQSFIDHIDTLIDNGPAFNKNARGKT